MFVSYVCLAFWADDACDIIVLLGHAVDAILSPFCRAYSKMFYISASFGFEKLVSRGSSGKISISSSRLAVKGLPSSLFYILLWAVRNSFVFSLVSSFLFQNITAILIASILFTSFVEVAFFHNASLGV